MATIEFVTWTHADQRELWPRLLALEAHIPRPHQFNPDEWAVKQRFTRGEYPATSIGALLARIYYGRN